ncbi:MAG: hypothetical protein QUV05_18775, partial [Phycisphaerae bacterium]|nr:hypothetical protein [Phycisphaerae bacterium]
MNESMTVKAVLDTDEWELDVLGCPYGGPNGGKDAQGEYFAQDTKFHEDRFGLPPVVYYHGYGDDGRPASEPVFIGRTLKRWRDAAGEWFRVRLDKASAEAMRVWDAAKQGAARASSGAVSHLVRTDSDGHIRHWPVAELSIFETTNGKQPANAYAVAMIAAKSLWSEAGLSLPDIDEAETVAVAEGSPVGEYSTTGGQPVTYTITEEPTMDEIENRVAEAVKAAIAAEKEAQAREAEAARVKALEAENAAFKAAQVADNRLPSAMPYVTKFADTNKFDNLTPAEHAFLIDVARQSYRTGAMKNAISDAAVRGLALKMEAEAGKSAAAAQGLKAYKLFGPGEQIKANEINNSGLASYGDEWVGVQYSTDLWEAVRAGSWVVANIPQSEIPRGYESNTIPLESVDPTWYKVAQAIDNTSGRPDVTVTSSKVGTAKKDITLGKMGCRVIYSGEMEEDSLIPWVPNAMRQIQVSGSEIMEHVVIDGDTETADKTNINDIAGQPAGTETFLLTNGFRKLPLITNTANARNGGAITAADFVETAMLMGRAGMYAADPSKVSFICDPHTFAKVAQLAEVYTKDVYSRPTLENSFFAPLYIFGYMVRPSWFMHNAGVLMATVTTATYMNKANSAGKIDQDVEANNTLGALLAVRWDQWALKWKRRMTIETQRIPESDATQIVALARWGLGYRDTDA